MLKIISKVGRQRSDRNWVPSLLFSKRCSKDHLSVRSGKFENLLRACSPAATYLNALPVLCEKQVFFWSRSLDVFHSFRAAKGLKMEPQHGPKLDLVLGRFLEASWGRLGGILGAPWGRLGGVLERLGHI